jgi:outer membrane protein insertion porin family
VKYLPAVSISFACLLLVTASVEGQTHAASKELPPKAFQLVAVKVSGTERYKLEDVVRASGLELGRTVHEDNFQDAARVLGDTGAFASVAYRFEYAPEGTTLELQVQDAPSFVPARFDNLVWFSDQELSEKLHTRVPLFNGQLPVTGKLPDDLSEALQGLVDEKRIPGRVDYTRVAQGEGPTEAFVYSVTGPRISIGNVEIRGASVAELPRLEAAAKKLQGAEYSRSAFRTRTDKSFLPIYLEQGYLQAQFGEPEARVVETNPNDVQVDVTLPVVPGKQYKLTSIEFRGFKAFPDDALRKLVHLQLGQPANVRQLSEDLEAMKQLYGTHGYVNVRIDPAAQINELESSVGYVVDIKEGEVFKMGDLELLGVDPQTAGKLQNLWTLRSGDTYDSSYAPRFIARALKEVLTTGEWNTDLQETPNRKDKTVDVTLRFDSKQ